jgi:putative transcriptional regulator
MKNRVRALRSASGLSQGALGEELGVSRQTINSIEQGRYLPSLPLAMAIARHFATTVEDVFEPEEDD